MTSLTSGAEAHAARRLVPNLSAKTPADISKSRASESTLIVEIFEDDHRVPMIPEFPHLWPADTRLDLDTVAPHSMDDEPLNLPSLCLLTVQELQCQARGNTLDFDNPGQQQVVVNVKVDVPDTSCNVEPPPRESDSELAAIALSGDVDSATPEANEEKPGANPSEVHSAQSELSTTEVANQAISMSGKREDTIPGREDCREDITPFTYDPTLGKELYKAVKNNSIQTVKFLLKTGANANAAAPDFGSVLNVAVSLNFLEVAQLLLKHRADVQSTVQSHNRKNNTQFTALNFAVSGGFCEMVELLLNKLEELGEINLAVATTKALQCTLFQGTPQQRPIMKLLLGKHVDVNARDSRGSTLLDRAISFGSREAIKVLLEGGANISPRNRTALHRMLVDTDELQRFLVDVKEVTEFLDEHGANQDCYGELVAVTISGVGKERNHLSTELSAGTVRSESQSPSQSTESADNSTPKTSPSASKGTQNDPMFKFAAQCFIDILTQMQSQSQKGATVDRKPLETKFNIDTNGGNSTIEFECTVITPVENTSTSDSTATADLPASLTFAVQLDETESKFHATFTLKPPVLAANEKKDDSTPKAKQPMSYPLDVKTNEFETQFPIHFQVSTMNENGGFQGSYGGIDIQKIIDANLVFLYNPEKDTRVGPWWGFKSPA
ncbi:hypothetical protein BGX38DRAFT_1157144 [Terfezia claveryi]|nr:hypothetical protein BGX38DRAFT_1157144 [Terfezia claveryi]